jgi:hypothetical protein
VQQHAAVLGCRQHRPQPLHRLQLALLVAAAALNCNCSALRCLRWAAPGFCGLTEKRLPPLLHVEALLLVLLPAHLQAHLTCINVGTKSAAAAAA